ncbi:MAG TPA: amino acid permease [Vicinamibacterales bacterium]
MAAPALERRLGSVDAAAIIVSNVIGSGIFLTPAFVAALTGDAWSMIAVWLLGGGIAFAGAMAYAELAALRPRAGGEYVYLREAFGPPAAFLTGWTSFVAGFSGAIAASAVGFAGYIGRFVPAAGDVTPLVDLPLGIVHLTVSPQALVAILLIALLSLVHIRGLGPGRLVQNVLAGAKVTGLVLLILLGFGIGDGAWTHFGAPSAPPPGSWLLALVPVMFSYSGWNAASYVAEEIRDPARFLPRALFLGTGAVVLLYVILNVLYVYSIPVDVLATLDRSVMDVIAERLFGPRAGDLLAILTAVSIAASVSAMIIAGPRVYFAMARDGVFFRRASQVHPRYHTPAVAIVAQAVWSSLLVLTGSFSQLISYTGFAVVLFSGIAGIALFVLRRRFPDEPRPFRAWGYPVMPGLFVLASALIVANAIWRDPGPSAAGLLIMAAGLPLYFVLTRKR